MLGWTMSKLADMLPRTPWPVCLLPAPLSPPPHTHTSSACLSVFIYACVCVCVCFYGGGHPPSPSIRPHSSALRPVKHSWDISPTPLSPSPRLNSYPILSSAFLPLLPLLAPQTWAGSFDTGVSRSKGEHFHFYLLRRLRDPPPSPISRFSSA